MSGKLIVNEVLPRDLRSRIQASAKERNITENAEAVWALSNHYGVLPPANPGKYRPLKSDRFKLRVPEKLHLKMRVDAAKQGATMRGIALSVLSQSYGTGAISPMRRPRKEAA